MANNLLTRVLTTGCFVFYDVSDFVFYNVERFYYMGRSYKIGRGLR